jgi:GNAT superfamily N-acetyltransferase
MLATIDEINSILPLYMECLHIQPSYYVDIKDGIEKFLFEHLGRDVFISCILNDGIAVSMATLSVGTFAPDNMIYFYGGKFGMLKNIYTSPDYRGRRFASGCINELICFAEDSDIRYVFSKAGDSKILDVLKFSKVDDIIYMIDMCNV